MRYVLLLSALVLVLCVLPLLNTHASVAQVLQLGALTLVFVAGVHANRDHPRVYYIGIAATIPALLVLWTSLRSETTTVSLPGVFVVSVYCLVMSACILVAVFRDAKGSPEAIVGAVCAYLLIGLGWAFLYEAAVRIDAHALRVNTTYPSSFMSAETPLLDYVYFSFITMSTVGYGDVSPMTGLARTMAWVQSVVGQFYLAALVARLISAMPNRLARSRET